MMETAVTALRYRGWSEAVLEEHFILGLEYGDKMLQEEGLELPKEPTLN